MDIEKIITWIGYGIALAGVFWKLKSDIRNTDTSVKKDKENINLKFQIIENEHRSQKELIAMQFQNKAEKVEALFKFKDEISQTMTREFQDLKTQISKVSEAVGNIKTTLELCDVSPKRREGDK